MAGIRMENKIYEVGMYCRLSKDDGTDNESASIATQKSILTDYVKKQGWHLAKTYVDDGYSGTNFQRPSFQNMIKDIESGLINCVITKDLSRLGRNYLDCGLYLEVFFPEHNVRYIAVNDGVDTLNKSAMDITPFRNILNEMYSADVSVKIKSAYRARFQQGKFMGTTAPYGYVKDPADHNHLLIDDKVAHVVREIFDLALAGNGIAKIRKHINKQHILRPAAYAAEQGATGYERYFEENEENRYIWSENSVRGILRSPIYAGNLAGYKRIAANMKSKKRPSKLPEAEQENAAVEGAHKAELLGEKTVRYAVSRSSRRLQESLHTERQAEKTAEAGRLQFEAMKKSGKEVGKHAAEVEQSKKNAILRFWQKRRYKQAYAAAKEGKKATEDTIRVTETIAVKAKKVLQEILCRNRAIFAGIGVCVLLFAVMAASLSSCSASIQGGSTTIISTTYASEDEDIYAAENAYAQLEAALNNQINSMEATHPEYEEYRYQVDEISHNPYHLISYLTVKYGDFTYAQVASEIEEIFREQYSIHTESVRETVTETQTVRVGESLGQVVTSGYCNCPICCGVWSGGSTASGAMPQANHTIAVDASNPFVPLGTKIVMNGVEYVVEDTGAFDQYGVQFDVYYGDHAAASAHGHQTWEAYIADDNGSQEVEVTSTREVNRLETVLTNHNLDTVLRNRMNDEEEQRYDYYNLTYGNRDYLFDVNTLPSGGGSGGFGYEIPAEALSDEKFANMIHEAEKYLGYPYVWGGASPSTSFDCSGFVSWVINNCGNGWNVGRQTADGLRSCCAYVSPSEAKPGDLIFFQGTYNTPGASHVGIYVGDNMMIHCGNPIQYANISSAYWQEHFMAFGRIQ